MRGQPCPPDHPVCRRPARRGSGPGPRVPDGAPHRTNDLVPVALVCSARPGSTAGGMIRLPPQPPRDFIQPYASGSSRSRSTPAGGFQCVGGQCTIPNARHTPGFQESLPSYVVKTLGRLVIGDAALVTPSTPKEWVSCVQGQFLCKPHRRQNSQFPSGCRSSNRACFRSPNISDRPSGAPAVDLRVTLCARSSNYGVSTPVSGMPLDGGMLGVRSIASTAMPRAAPGPRPAPRPQHGPGTTARGVRRRGAPPLDPNKSNSAR